MAKDKAKDITGQRFSRLVAISRAGVSSRGTALWLVRCDCGNEKIANGGNLRIGNTKSCGCLKIESALNAGSKYMLPPRIIHGETSKNARSTEWRCWMGMRQRCRDPNHKNFKNYGARGIKVCARWQLFAAFLEDMGRKPSPAHTIDRINNDGDYEPGNCRWVTVSEQNSNQRRSRKNR